MYISGKVILTEANSSQIVTAAIRRAVFQGHSLLYGLSLCHVLRRIILSTVHIVQISSQEVVMHALSEVKQELGMQLDKCHEQHVHISGDQKSSLN